MREPGPSDRIYSWRNNCTNLYEHSMVGYRGGYSALTDPNRFPTAWHGDVALDDNLYQHYPIYCGLAHGGPLANPYGPGFEAEGGLAPYNEPLTTGQVTKWLDIIRDMEQAYNRPYRRGVYRQGLVEHNEASNTACPSDRYRSLYYAIANGALDNSNWENAMASAEYNELRADLNKAMALIAANGYGDIDANGVPDMTGEAAWNAAVSDGGSLFLGLGNTQAALAKLETATGKLALLVISMTEGKPAEPKQLAAVNTEIKDALEAVQQRIAGGYIPNEPVNSSHDH